MTDCQELCEVTPLAGMNLADAFLPSKVTKGMDALRAMKTLERINYLPAAEFWKKWDAAKSKGSPM